MQSLRGKQILVLEDEPLITLLLQDELEAAGAIVTAFHNCKDALEAVRSHRFDAATLDLHIRDRDCTEVADLLHQQGVPFVITTGDLHAPHLGAAAQLNKPFSPEHLVAALLSTLPAATLSNVRGGIQHRMRPI
jgi:CheY-like chemotaxis protein